ncbi:ABC transporter permease [Leucobacter sp. UCD-THU]|jgi:ribose transport system permease protein|uniref:ABC transporter permease n=1 Tax=Leucobacter sp. UCD-THU TaxID=1292023 RepID=UPI0003738766|nr:ABC transporter permease [Leucobacter sp. UCD-THU]EYT51663.1 ABC transporter permease [Leucobacter sp. UCD-THU]
MALEAPTTTEISVDTKKSLRGKIAPNLVFIAPVVMMAVIGIQMPSVLTVTGITSLLVLAAILGIASVGQTWAIITGGIDLSIPAVIGLACVAVAKLTASGVPFGTILLLLLGLSIVIGLVHGVLSSVLPIHPLIITLGTGSIITGGVLWATGGRTGGVIPQFITDAVSPVASTGPIPVPAAILLWAVIAVVAILLQSRTAFGLQMYALGANSTAASYALVRPWLVRSVVYTLSAVFAAMTGILLAGFSGTASADIGVPYMFQTLTAVVVGGTSLLGGRGGYGRTIAGVLLTTQFTMLLIGFGVSSNLQQVFLGLVILVLIAIYGRDRHIANRL